MMLIHRFLSDSSDPVPVASSADQTKASFTFIPILYDKILRYKILPKTKHGIFVKELEI